MSVNQKHSIGKIGEQIAFDYLLQRGYSIAERNFKCVLGEIDLIAVKDKRIHFVEVKTRSSFLWGYPEEHLKRAQIKRASKAAQIYLGSCRIEYTDYQFDIMAILLKKDRREHQIEHFCDVHGGNL